MTRKKQGKAAQAPRIKHTVGADELATLPPPIQSLYGPGQEVTGKKELQHQLNIDADTLPERKSAQQQQQAADKATDLQLQTAQRIAARIGIKPSAMSDALAAITASIRIEKDAAGNDMVAFQDAESGLTIRSSEAGNNGPVSENEFVSRYFEPDESWLHPKQVAPEPDAPEVFKPRDRRDVQITSEQMADVRIYEEARELASSRGSKVVVVDAVNQATRQFEPGSGDVPLTHEQAQDLEAYTAAKQLAAEQGGQVVFVDDPRSNAETRRAATHAAIDKTSQNIKAVADAADLQVQPRETF